MKKGLMVLILLIAFISIGIAGLGGVITTSKNITLDYSTTDKASLDQGIGVNDLNGLTYSYSCDGNNSCLVTFNKLIYDNNKCVTEVGVTTCGKRITGSVFQDKQIIVDLTNSKLSKEEIIKTALQNELKAISDIELTRKNRVTPAPEQAGQIFIK